MGISEITRVGAKRTQAWLRADRRLERMLRRGRLSGVTTLYSHELVVPLNSTYAPWHDDIAFRRAYNAVNGHTLVDQYRCFELWEQLGQLSSVPGDILEVGVWRGGTGVLMATRALQLGFQAKVWLADTFTGVAKAGSNDPWYKGGEHDDTSPELVQGLADAQGVQVGLLQGMFPDDTAHAVTDRSFRLVHIDVDVYASARETLMWAWPRLSRGGVVLFDDYGSFECEGIATLGREIFAAGLAHVRIVHNLNGHLLLVKMDDEPLAF